jgi:hypothetical protein
LRISISSVPCSSLVFGVGIVVLLYVPRSSRIKIKRSS